ncbi:MAG: aminodeoxychorismate/anthranilate synthase component II [Gemmatimonadetes bacterium]|nr:aminodeoxychorismate/anthranilate synthase component II [Gemmatimonadota bacterium]
MILIIDNYDSFTWNLVQLLAEDGAEVQVVRNDETDVAHLAAMRPTHLVISPGPGDPSSAGVSLDAIRQLAGEVPILGVCLGHQAIGEAFGGRVVRARHVMHGKTSAVRHHGRGVFAGLPNPLRATRYHSLAVSRDAVPECLEVTAWTDDGEIMGVRHRELPIEGVQFHPESILSEAGRELLANFVAQGPLRRPGAETACDVAKLAQLRA